MTINYNGTVTLTDACISLKPNAGVSISSEDLSTIVWDAVSIAEDSLPTNSEITTEKNRLQAIEDAKAYARNRAAEYPSIADQLDDIYHNGIDAWKATIKTTKDKYPKP